MLTEDLKTAMRTIDLIKNRTSIEAFDYVLFNGQMAIAFNGTVGVITPLEVDEPFSVPMAEFSKVVKSCRAKEVDITMAEEQVRIKCGRLKANIITQFMPESEFEEILSIEDVKMKKVPDDFITALEMCARTSSNSVTMDVLNSVFVNEKEVVGSDDARLTVYTLDKKMGKFILPYASVRDVAKFNPKKIGMRAGGGWVVFSNEEGDNMVVRTISDDYPEYKTLFDVETFEAKIPAEVSDLILSASVFSETNTDEEYSEVVRVRIKAGGVAVRSANHMGSISNSVKCKTGLDSTIEIAAHPKMFVEAVALSEGKIGVGEDRIIIKSEKVRHAAGLQDGEE